MNVLTAEVNFVCPI